MQQSRGFLSAAEYGDVVNAAVTERESTLRHMLHVVLPLNHASIASSCKLLKILVDVPLWLPESFSHIVCGCPDRGDPQA
jgi:hypothetical protein